MTFKEQLEKANELGLNVLDLRVALEVKDTIESSLYSDFSGMGDNAYNALCSIIRDIYLKADSDVELTEVIESVLGHLQTRADMEGFENEEQFINAIQNMRKSRWYKC